MPNLTAIKKGATVYRVDRFPHPASITEHTVRSVRLGVITLDNGETFSQNTGIGFYKHRGGTYTQDYRIFESLASMKEYGEVVALRSEAFELFRLSRLQNLNLSELKQLVSILSCDSP